MMKQLKGPQFLYDAACESTNRMEQVRGWEESMIDNWKLLQYLNGKQSCCQQYFFLVDW
jgi:hypothetical protein